MPWALVLAHLLLPIALATVAGFGAWRCWRLSRYAQDARLLRLMWFYGLFAASIVPMAIWTGRLAAEVGNLGTGGVGGWHDAFAGAERVDGFLLAHHALMLASLAVAVQAFGHKRAQGAPVLALALVSFAPFIFAALALEAAMTLYLAVRAILNHRRRRTPGALQVAAGFLLFFIGHLGFFLFHEPASARAPFGDVFALVGLVLLVRLLPRPVA